VKENATVTDVWFAVDIAEIIVAAWLVHIVCAVVVMVIRKCIALSLSLLFVAKSYFTIFEQSKMYVLCLMCLWRKCWLV